MIDIWLRNIREHLLFECCFKKVLQEFSVFY